MATSEIGVAVGPFVRAGEYETWLRQFVRQAETGRKLATHLSDSARRHGQRLNEQRFASHAERLYKEEVYWTLQIQGVASLAAHAAEAPTPPKEAPSRQAKATRSQRKTRSAKG
ncbi:MAG TPA: hypothetical protein VL993_04745 [Stellaceae bacterium]|nr:hypothetical protein [Stellaceae bacterium]